MESNKLKTAILGLVEKGRELLESAAESDFYDVIAVADSDMELAGKYAAEYNCTAFDDYRQLMIQNQLDVLLVAAPIHLCAEHIRTAMNKKFNILKLPPGGVNFEQSAELSRLATKAGVKFTIANIDRFRPGFAALRNYLLSKGTGAFYFISAVCNVPVKGDDSQDRWLTDPQLAGGGVLLQNCYGLIDQIVLNFNIPEQVYSLNTNRAPDKQQRLSITEDTAIVTMKFSDTLLGNIVAGRNFSPPQQTLTIHGADICLTATADSFVVCDNSGNVIDKIESDEDAQNATAKMLENFALSILSPETNAPLADTYLNNMAVIEAAYLSARTAMPEEPAKILTLT